MFDPALLMQYLLGTWKCTFHGAGTQIAYTATYSRGFAKPWIRQTDTWTGGGSDEGLYAIDPGTKRWTAVFLEPNGSTTVLSAMPTGETRIDYNSAYPDHSATEIFQRVSGSQYTLNYSQTLHGKTTRSHDVCTKDR